MKVILNGTNIQEEMKKLKIHAHAETHKGFGMWCVDIDLNDIVNYFTELNKSFELTKCTYFNIPMLSLKIDGRI